MNLSILPSGPFERSEDWRDVSKHLGEAKAALSSNTLSPSEREQTLMGLVGGLERAKDLIGKMSVLDLSAGLGGAAAAVQGERQLRALKEQTETLNAGQFAMWRQTLEGRAYMAWEAAASALLVSVAERDALIQAAIRADLATPKYKKPHFEPVPEPTVPPEPKREAFVESEGPGCFVGFLFVAALIWLIVEVVIGLFGAAGLLNNWGVLAIVVGTFILIGLSDKKRMNEEKYDQAVSDRTALRESHSRAVHQNQEGRERYLAELSLWEERVEHGLGLTPDAPERFEWLQNPQDRAALERLRLAVLDGRRTFPSPETLPIVDMPEPRRQSGNDPESNLNRVLKRFNEVSG